MDYNILYSMIYALAAGDGREKALFGDCYPASAKALARSLAGRALPEIWFELPLKGEPRFDLHAMTHRKAADPDGPFPAEKTGGFPEAFRWFARQGDSVNGLCLSWDLCTGAESPPAAQLLVSREDPGTVSGFLRAVGREDAEASFRAFSARIPREWFICYYAVFPGRPGTHLRVECVPTFGVQAAYAKDPGLLRKHLEQAGFRAFGDTLIPRCRELADTPFRMEFQFDVGPDGLAGPVLGVSLRFSCPPGEGEWQCFDPEGEAGKLMDRIQEWGLTDGRWRLLADTAFAWRVRHGGEDCRLYCYTAYVKLRWRAGEPMDAKAYLVSGTRD